MLATDLPHNSPPAEEVLSEDETARRLEVARFMGPPADLHAHREAAGIRVVALVEATGIDAGVFIRVERGEAAPVDVEAYLRALLLVEEARGFPNYRWVAQTRSWLDSVEGAR